MNQQKIQFKLNISLQDYLRHYHGHTRDVIAQTVDGNTLCFPASRLRDFIKTDGIHGQFEIEWNAHNKLQSLRQI